MADPSRLGTVFVAHPSADVYGSDLQLLQTVRAFRARGWDVVVHLPTDGPLRSLLEDVGAEVLVHDFAVVRRSLLSPGGILNYAKITVRSYFEIRFHLRKRNPDLVMVNTVTVPVWLAAARSVGIPSICHVHEAEDMASHFIRFALFLPAAAASVVVANSVATRRAIGRAVPFMSHRTRVIYNGVVDRTATSKEGGLTPEFDGPLRLVLVGRLSRIKGTDVALEAVAGLVENGIEVVLDLCGSVFPGYEGFETQLRDRAAQPDLAGRVRFMGYVSDIGAVLEGADVVIVPSRQESFGNAAVEAMMAGRPVVVSAVQGLTEVVTEGVTGLLVPPENPFALAAAITKLAAEPALASGMARKAQAMARERFSVTRYGTEIDEAVHDALRARSGRLRTRR